MHKEDDTSRKIFQQILFCVFYVSRTYNMNIEVSFSIDPDEMKVET